MHVVRLQIPNPMWCPEKLEGPSGNFTELLPVTGETFNCTNNQGLMYQAEEVRRCLGEGEFPKNKLLLPYAMFFFFLLTFTFVFIRTHANIVCGFSYLPPCRGN